VPRSTRYDFAVTLDWQELSDIGETYAVAAAILSALTLAAVALSLGLQARQNRQGRIQALREGHVELMKLALDDPSYFQCWGPFNLSGVDERLVSYTNLIISHWEARWDLGEMNAEACTALARSFFAGEMGRLYWECYGERRSKSTVKGRRTFYRIMNSEFLRAAADGPPTRRLGSGVTRYGSDPSLSGEPTTVPANEAKGDTTGQRAADSPIYIRIRRLVISVAVRKKECK
jgi:hypothetical protein